MKKLLILLLLTSSGFAFGAAANCTPVQTAVINITSSGDTTVVAANGDKQVIVWQFFMVNNHATNDTNVTLKDGASTSQSGAYLLKANGGSQTAICTGVPWAVTSKGNAFIINSSAAASLQGELYWSFQ